MLILAFKLTPGDRKGSRNLWRHARSCTNTAMIARSSRFTSIVVEEIKKGKKKIKMNIKVRV
jgi:hypothetical protein